MAIDPVCLKEVDEKATKYKSKVRGKIYYSTDAECKKSLMKIPLNIWTRKTRMSLHHMDLVSSEKR